MSAIFTLGFTGTYQDPVTEGYPLGNGYRMYLPEMMRFSAPDGWSPFGRGGINPYVYCVGDPINCNDPSGHLSFLLGLGLFAMTLVPGAGEVADAAAEIVAADDAIVDVLNSTAEGGGDVAIGARQAMKRTAGSTGTSASSMTLAAEECGETPVKRAHMEGPGADKASTSQQVEQRAPVRVLPADLNELPSLSETQMDERIEEFHSRFNALDQSVARSGFRQGKVKDTPEDVGQTLRGFLQELNTINEQFEETVGDPIDAWSEHERGVKYPQLLDKTKRLGRKIDRLGEELTIYRNNLWGPPPS